MKLLCGEKLLNYDICQKKIIFQNPYLSSNSDLYDFNGNILPVQIKKMTTRNFPLMLSFKHVKLFSCILYAGFLVGTY